MLKSQYGIPTIIQINESNNKKTKSKINIKKVKKVKSDILVAPLSLIR